MRLSIQLILFLVGTSLLGQSASNQVIQMLQHLKAKEVVKARSIMDGFATINEKALWEELREEQVAKAFWINFYNATVQLLLTEDPSRFDDRDAFFQKEWITIAGQKLSLDVVEHGIIRNSKNKYALGYAQKLFVGDFEEKFRLGKVDYRVHFALNCGAKSCPPVGIYKPETLNAQLDKGSKRYLLKEVEFKPKKNEIYVPRLCFWFSGDFGGESGVIDMLRKYGFSYQVNDDADIEYLEYDWTLFTGNYIEL